MRCVVQVVSGASVVINGSYGGSIGRGLAIMAAYKDADTEAVVDKMCDKLVNLRVFPDKDGKLNLSVLDVGGELMCISNFTVYGDTSHGRRPSYTLSAKPEISKPLYLYTLKKLSESVCVVAGEFGADMQVSLTNDGPITLILEL